MKYKIGQRVILKHSLTLSHIGIVTERVVRYKVKQGDGMVFWVEESNLSKEPAPGVKE